MNAKGPLVSSISRHLFAGVSVVALVGFGVGGLASHILLAGAVIASGQLVVDSNVKRVQHPTGGVVGALHVREGDRVKTGDVVLRLDDTLSRAQLQIVSKSIDEMAVRKLRLQAERDEKDEMDIPDDLLARAVEEAELAQAINGERKLFELRRVARFGRRAQLKERLSQGQEEVKGLTMQVAAKQAEMELLKVERDAMHELLKKSLVTIGKFTALERDAVKTEGEGGQLISQIARTRDKISEIELQIIQIDHEMRTEVGTELADIRAKSAEMAERKISAADQLKRVDIRAPQDGQVFQLAAHTVGGVVAPGETIMLVVPEGDALMAEAKIAPQDINQLRYGQQAILRFSSLNARTTPEISGEITRISADLVQDQRTGTGYYTVRISFSAEEAARLGPVTLVPGMPVEAYVQTGVRTAMNYLMKPLSDQLAKAFKDK